ncbi:hypothetical protein [Neisseria sicca]
MIRLLGCDREKYTLFAAAGSSETRGAAFFRRPFDVWQWAGEVALCSVGFAGGGLGEGVGLLRVEAIPCKTVEWRQFDRRFAPIFGRAVSIPI